MEGRFTEKYFKKLAAWSGVAVIFCIFFINVAHANAANLYFSPSAGSYAPGDSFSVSVYVNSSDQAMNAASGTISFPIDKLEVTSVSKSGSVITFWAVEPNFNNASGRVNFEGVILTANGYTGSSGKLVSINFKIKAAGTANVSFSNGSVLANDGLGTNILTGMGSASFKINSTEAPKPEVKPAAEPIGVPKPVITAKPEEESTPSEITKSEYVGKPVITSSTHPDQDAWYNVTDALFEWDMPYSAKGVSIIMTDSPSSNPGPESDGLFFAKKYKDLEDGVHYVHLKIQDDTGWSEIDHYRVQIDTAPPKSFKINVKIEEQTGHALVSFQTTDELSGIARYRIKIDDDYFESTSQEYLMDIALMTGEHSIIVRAIDAAGNETLAAADLNITKATSSGITIFQDKLKITDKLFLGGTDQPQTTLNLFVKSKGATESIIQEKVVTDSSGKWTFIYDQKLLEGDYVGWVQREDSAEPEDKIEFTISSPVVWQIGGLSITYYGIIIFLTNLLLVTVLIFLYFKYIVKGANNNYASMRELIDSSFTAHKKLISKEIDKLGKIKDVKKCNIASNKAKGVLMDSLDEIEKKMSAKMRRCKK